MSVNRYIIYNTVFLILEEGRVYMREKNLDLFK